MEESKIHVTLRVAQILAAVATVSSLFAQVPLRTEDLRFSDVWWPEPHSAMTPGYLGRSVTVDGEWAAVMVQGEHHPRDPAESPGVVYVYRRTHGGWRLHQVLATPEPYTSGVPSKVLFHDGDLFLSSPQDDVPAAYCGRVFVFRLAGASWTHRQTILSPRPTRLQGFGFGLSAFGDRLLVGAPGDDQHGQQTGAVFEYQRVGEHWVHSGVEIPHPTGMYVSGMGGNIALHGDTAAVLCGREALTGLGSNRFVVGVFRRVNGAWIVETKLVRPDPLNRWDFFGGGREISISPDWIGIGSTQDTALGTVTGPGRVYMFPRNPAFPGGWGPPQVLEASNATFTNNLSDFFGHTVSIRGERMLVTAPHQRAIPGTETSVGQVYLFELEAGIWRERLRFSSRRLQNFTLGMQSIFGEHGAFDGGQVFISDSGDSEGSVWLPHWRGALFGYELPLGSTFCVQAGGPSLELRGVLEAPHAMLDAHVTGAQPGDACVVIANGLHAAVGLPAMQANGLCLAASPMRAAVGTVSAAGDVTLPFGGPLGMPYTSGRWSFQALCIGPAPRATNAVTLTLE